MRFGQLIFKLVIWYIVCVVICGVSWIYTDGSLDWIAQLCASSSEIKSAMCYGQTFAEGDFTDRHIIVSSGGNYFVWYQKLEPIFGIPLAVYWSLLWLFYIITDFFWYNEDTEESESQHESNHKQEDNYKKSSVDGFGGESTNKQSKEEPYNNETNKGYDIQGNLYGIFFIAAIFSTIGVIAMLFEFIFLLQGKESPIPTPSTIPKDILDNRLIVWVIAATTFLYFSIKPKIESYASDKHLIFTIEITKSLFWFLFIIWIPFLFYCVVYGVPINDMKGIYLLTDSETNMGALIFLIFFRFIIEIVNSFVSKISLFKVINLLWCMVFLFFIPPWLSSLKALFNKELWDYNAVNYPGAANFQLYAFLILTVIGLILFGSQQFMKKIKNN